MLQGNINLYGLAFLLSAVSAYLWYRRLKHSDNETLNKDLWLKVLKYIGLFVFLLGATFWIDNPIWFRTTLIVGHVFMIPAMYYISKMWWRLGLREMPVWWGWLIISINLVFLASEVYYAFLGYLPESFAIAGNITVLIRNDHPSTAWLFIPAVWSSWWPMGFVFIRQGIRATGAKLKARLFVFGATWILGSSMAVYSNFVVEPAKILRGNLVLITVFSILIIAVLLKSNNSKPTEISQPEPSS